MRKRIWISFIIVLVVCLLLILLGPAQHRNIIVPATSVTQTNSPSQTAEVKPVGHHHATNIQKMLVLPPNATPLAQAIAKTNPVTAKVLADWQAPINFYGKFVDENSNDVPQLEVINLSVDREKSIL